MSHRGLKMRALLRWPGMIDAILRGLIVRRPDLALAAGYAWAHIVLPYYREPYYQVSKTGAASSAAAINFVPDNDLEPLVDLLRHRIEIEGAYDIREQLLIVLLVAFRARGGSSTALCLALDRWRREAPPPKPGGTNSLPNRFIGAQTLGELANMIGERDPDYQTVKAAEKLILSTPFADVRAFAAAHPRLCEDSRLAYALTRRAVAAGENSYARDLLKRLLLRV